MSGIFDPDTFLDAEVAGANSTERLLCPVGVYTAVIDDIKATTGEKDGRAWAMMNVRYSIEDAAVLAEQGREKVTVRQSFFLDLTEEGGIDTGKGKNVALGKLRRATGKNEGRFSPRDLLGCRCLVEVKHFANKDGDLNDEVRSVAALD